MRMVASRTRQLRVSTPPSWCLLRARLRAAWQNLLAARQAEAAKRSGVSNQESALSVKTPCTHAVWHIHYQNTTARIAPKDIGVNRGRSRKRLRCVHFGMEEYDARGAAAGGQDRRKRAYDDAAPRLAVRSCRSTLTS
jgi:hypothetical protein